MLSVEPILERALRMSGAGAVLGRAVVLEALVVVLLVAAEEVGRAARGTGGFFSGTLPVVEDGVAALAAAAVRVRDAAVVETELRVPAVVEVLGLVESAVEVLRVPGFFSSPGLLSVLEARGFLAAVVILVRGDAIVRTDDAVLLAAVVAVPFLVAALEPG